MRSFWNHLFFGVFDKIAITILATILVPTYYGIADLITLLCLVLIFVVAEIISLALAFVIEWWAELTYPVQTFSFITSMLSDLLVFLFLFPYVPALYIASRFLPGFTINSNFAFFSLCFTMLIVNAATALGKD